MILELDEVFRHQQIARVQCSPQEERTQPAIERANREVSFLSVKELERSIQDYLLDCKYRLNSQSTIDTRRTFLNNFVWFLHRQGFEQVGKDEIKQFMLYLYQGHEEEGGRWGNARFSKPLRPVSIKDYYVALKLLFTWLVRDEAIESSPMSSISAPMVQAEQVRTFTAEQILALVKAAKKSIQPLRNEAIIWFLFDTGVRASELCNLKMGELDMDERHCIVLGKGNKQRHIYFGRNTNRSLRHYLRKRHYRADTPVFLGERAIALGEGLSRSGLLQLIERLGRVAGLQAVRCSPHTFRHTFAIEFLRAGGNQFTLKELLGHTTLQMTNKYVALAQADIQAQHRQFSPADRITYSVS